MRTWQDPRLWTGFSSKSSLDLATCMLIPLRQSSLRECIRSFDQSDLYNVVPWHSRVVQSDMYGSTQNLALCRMPSLSQIAAIRDLHNVESTVILAWISLLRALQPGFLYASRPGGLTAQQFDAVVTLMDCPDSLLLDLLESRQCAR